MNIDDARKIMDADLKTKGPVADPAQSLAAVASVLRHYGLGDKRLAGIAADVQHVADEVAAKQESKPTAQDATTEGGNSPQREGPNPVDESAVAGARLKGEGPDAS
jgi:hypothetical protein